MISDNFGGYIMAKAFVVDRESKADILIFAVDHDYKAKWKKSNTYQNRL
jgi:hypothetical protein